MLSLAFAKLKISSFISSTSRAIASLSEAPRTSLEACIINSWALIIILDKFSKFLSNKFNLSEAEFTFLSYCSICFLTTFKPDSSTEPTGSSEARKIFSPVAILFCKSCNSSVVEENCLSCC